MKTKTLRLLEAKEAFKRDLQNDPDFIAYKQQAVRKDFSYGVLVAAQVVYILEAVVTSQALVYGKRY